MVKSLPRTIDCYLLTSGRARKHCFYPEVVAGRAEARSVLRLQHTMFRARLALSHKENTRGHKSTLSFSHTALWPRQRCQALRIFTSISVCGGREEGGGSSCHGIKQNHGSINHFFPCTVGPYLPKRLHHPRNASIYRGHNKHIKSPRHWQL